MFDRWKDGFLNFITSRMLILTLVFIGLGAVLIYRIFDLQIVNGQHYMNDFSLKIRKERSIPSSRGNIYDRNGKLLAYNELAYSVTIEDVYESGKNKNASLNATLLKLVHMIESNGDSVISDFNIYIDKSGNYAFGVSDTKLLRFLADIYGHPSIDDLMEKEKNATPQEVIDYMAGNYGIGERTDPDDKKTFVPGKGYTKDEVLKLVIIRYAMSANSFQKYIPTTVATNVSEKTVAAVKENGEELLGVDIAEDTVRRYVDGTYFSHIIGYTGKVSSEELETLNGENSGVYELNDTVGKSGIERVMESSLQGKKGNRQIYVDNLGKELESTILVEPEAGHDVYLSIDADLQEAVYNILERNIAGILYSKIDNVKEYNPAPNASASLIRIPIDDVYSALFENNVIDMERLARTDAGENEKAVYDAFLRKKESVFSGIRDELYNRRTPYNALSKEYKAYESYIVNTLLIKDTGVLSVNDNDDTYIAWSKDETLSLSEFLEYAISQNWIDVSRLQMSGRYADSKEVFDRLSDFIEEKLDNSNFYKLLYKYMIHDNNISGRQVCMVLHEQNLITVSDEELAKLSNGTVSAYTFMRDLIWNLQITPAQLALDPFSGSCVVVDPNTGEVLALVSYPSYDNNKLANGIDADYYASLQSDMSNPLWDYATQMRTASGSTFKMVSATTALMEGIADLSTSVTCNGYFNKLSDRVKKCWIAPGGHGSLAVSGAITNSCNIFFYEMGYRLSMANVVDPETGVTKEKYTEDVGLEKLEYYADLYGLTEKSGVEIEESMPQVSNVLPVDTAIGQGNSNFTTAGLARYVATVANSGTCYNLSLIDKVTDHSGNLLEEYTPGVRNTIEMPTAYWDAIHTGMRGVVAKMTYFNELDINVAGKTGTAQETNLRPSHALFVGYAPYERPQIALATRIAYGYNSGFAAQTSRDVIRYFFNRDDEEEILTGTAQAPESAGIAGD